MKAELLRILWFLYQRTRLDNVEMVLSCVPSPHSSVVAMHFRKASFIILLLLLPLLGILYIVYRLLRYTPIYLQYSKSLFGENEYLRKISIAKPTNGINAIVVIPDWPRCGSTVMYQAQISALSKAGFDVVLMVFSNYFYYYSHSAPDKPYQDVVVRQRKNFDLSGVVSVVVVPSVVSGTYLLNKARWNITRKTRLYQHSNLFGTVISGSGLFSAECEQASEIIVNRLTYLEYFKQYRDKVYLESHDVMAKTVEFDERGALEYELELAKNAKTIGCYTEQDFEVYSKVSNAKVIVSIPALLGDPPLFVKKTTKISSLLYVGDNHPQNVAAINTLLEHGVPDRFTLNIGGRVCNGINRELPKRNVKLLGFVEDLELAVLDSDLVVIPDVVGTGVSVKALEFLSYGVPVFLSARALRGINVQVPEVVVHRQANLEAFMQQIAANEAEILEVDFRALGKLVLNEYGKDYENHWLEKVIDHEVV